MKLIGIQAVNFGYHRSIVVCLKVVLFFIFWLCVKTLLAVLSLNQIVIKICLEFSIWFLSQLFQALVQRTLVEKILGQFTRIMVQIQMAEHHVNDCTGITMLAQDLRAARLEKLHFILVVGKQNIVIENIVIENQVLELSRSIQERNSLFLSLHGDNCKWSHLRPPSSLGTLTSRRKEIHRKYSVSD